MSCHFSLCRTPEHNEDGFQAVQYGGWTDHDALVVDVAASHLQHCSYRKTLRIDLIETRGHDRISRRHRLLIHNVIELAQVIANAFEHPLSSAPFQHGAHAAGGIGNEHHLRAIVKHADDLTYHPCRGEHRKVGCEAIVCSLVDQDGVGTSARAEGYDFRGHSLIGRVGLEIEQLP